MAKLLFSYLPTFGNQDTFNIAPTPHPPSYTHWEEKDQCRSNVHCTPQQNAWAVHIHVQFRSIKVNWKRPRKILIYVLNITLKIGLEYLQAEILENQDIPIFEGFKSQKLGLSWQNQDGYQVCAFVPVTKLHGHVRIVIWRWEWSQSLTSTN